MQRVEEPKKLTDGMWLTHEEYVLHLIDNGWNRADAEQCWREAREQPRES